MARSAHGVEQEAEGHEGGAEHQQAEEAHDPRRALAARLVLLSALRRHRHVRVDGRIVVVVDVVATEEEHGEDAEAGKVTNCVAAKAAAGELPPRPRRPTAVGVNSRLPIALEQPKPRGKGAPQRVG